MGERSDEKTAWGTASGEINVDRGAEGCTGKRKCGTTKTGGNTGPIQCDGAVYDVETCLVLK